MSGDVQPRKRKDKRRKKDEIKIDGEYMAQPLSRNIPEDVVHEKQTAAAPSSEDFNMHVHHDHGLGGNMCAKVIFFIIFAFIAVCLVGLFLEDEPFSQVSKTEAPKIEEPSFLSSYFGWLGDFDDGNSHAEEHDHSIQDEHGDEHDDHGDEHDEHGDDDEDDEHGDDDDDKHGDEDEHEEDHYEEVESHEDEEEPQVEEDEQHEEDAEQEGTEDLEAVDEDTGESEEQEVEYQYLQDEETQEELQDEIDQVSEEVAEEEEVEPLFEEHSTEVFNEIQQEESNEFQEQKSEEEQQDDEQIQSEEYDIPEEETIELNVPDNQIEEEVVEHDDEVEEVKTEEVNEEESSSEIKNQPELEHSDESEDEPYIKKSSSREQYALHDEFIDGTHEWKIQEEINLAEEQLQENAELGYKSYLKLRANYPDNLLIKYGHAKALDKLAELKRSNELLQGAINAYIEILHFSNLTNKLFLKIADRCIDRMRFRGHYNRAISVHNEIIKRFPNEPKYRNQLTITLLTINRLDEAKSILEEVLRIWPNNGFAQVHYGFIVKTKDNDMNKAVKYLEAGIKSKMPGVIDGRFYFHLGDALMRLGRNIEAMNVYEDGVNNNFFLSKYQRSLYNVDRLTGNPWWEPEKTPYANFFKMLETNWISIRNEGLALINKEGLFKDESENLRDTGDWKQFELFARGIKMVENCKKCPISCKIIESVPDARGCRRGQAKFSIMHPGTHVWPHCGPTNCRLRSHLGLKIPNNTFIRVAEKTRSWKEGRVLLFDDSFEHEVWHNGTDIRLVLIVDLWHPELTPKEKISLPAI